MKYNVDLFVNNNTATFGNRKDNADFPLGIFPMVREFVAQDGCKAILKKYNARLVPSWRKKAGAIQITKFSDIHHRGNVVCLKLRSNMKINVEKYGVRIFTRPDYQNYLMICIDHECRTMKEAFLQSIAILEVLVEVRAEGTEVWKKLASLLPQRLKEIEEEDEIFFNPTL